MTIRLTFASLLVLLFSAFSYAQTSTIRGTIRDKSQAGIPAAKILLRGTVFQAETNPEGQYEIANVPYGEHVLDISAEGYEVAGEIKITVNSPVTEAGTTELTRSTAAEQQTDLPTVSIVTEDIREESGMNVSTMLTSSRDPYNNASTFVFSPVRFRNRGYVGENVTYINGLQVRDLVSNRTSFGSWSGLNDVLRAREFTTGLSASGFSFGSLDGAYNITAKASNQRKQFQIGYAISNRAYSNRITATLGTGLLKGGWAFSAAFSRRWAEEGYVEGTFYDSWGWYFSAEKRLGLNQSISLTQFGVNSNVGRSSAAVQEVYDLAGTHYYNASWGYQDGKKRNAAVAHQQQPLTILNHEWKINNKSFINTSLGYQYGMYNLSGLDWFNAPDPRPDFYRRLPSYIDDPLLQSQAESNWRNDENFRQIDWTGMYTTNRNNYETITDANGIQGNDVTGRRSRYIVEDRVNETRRVMFNINDNTTVSDHLIIAAGYSYQNQVSRNYKTVNDLLGGDFYVDLNQFAEQQYPDSVEALYNDLNNPNHILHEGDKFGYDYDATIKQHSGWAQAQFKFDRIDYFAGVSINSNQFYRTGYTRNAIFADDSYGKSKVQQFTTYGVKGGATYKLNGRNYIFLNGEYTTRPPAFRNVFLSPRTRNTIVDNLTDEKITSVEGGYQFRSPKVKLKLTAFYTQLDDGVQTYSFYHEDYRTFVNYSLTNLDRRHIGLEIGADAALGKGFSVTAAASLGEYFYTDRALGTITQDNSPEILAKDELIYNKNFYIGGPQNLGTIGFSYRSKNFWSVYTNVNYFGHSFYGFNPARRTIAGVAPLADSDPKWNPVIDQLETENQMTVDASISYSWKVNNRFHAIKRNTFIVMNLGVTNILNNQDIINNAYEQLRFDFNEKDPMKFAPKISYAFGTTYFLSVALRFN